MNLISSKDSIYIIRNTLDHVDSRLLGHGEKVAFIIDEILAAENKRTQKEKETYLLLGLFHDIGAYKTEDINQMVQFESTDTWRHSVYGYLFLKNMSPLKAFAEAVLYHHVVYCDYKSFGFDIADDAICSLIHLADRIEVIAGSIGADACLAYIKHNEGRLFSPYWVKCFIEAENNAHIIERLLDKSYLAHFERAIDLIELTIEERRQFLSMVAFSIDFRSEVTVIHTITTVSVSGAMARLMGLPPKMRQKIYYGALLHDIGKVATPIEILEKDGRLTDEEMEIMKEHVVLTRTLLEKRLEPEIVEISARHHERMDGTGYPQKLFAKDLSQSQNIVAVADVISALVRQRSYKAAFSFEHTKGILQNMASENKLNAEIVNLAINNFDEIMKESTLAEKEVTHMYRSIGGEFQEFMSSIEEKIKR